MKLYSETKTGRLVLPSSFGFKFTRGSDGEPFSPPLPLQSGFMLHVTWAGSADIWALHVIVRTDLNQESAISKVVHGFGAGGKSTSSYPDCPFYISQLLSEDHNCC